MAALAIPREIADRELILANAYAREGDGVFVSGTLIEGIGNKYSDLDVYVIGSRVPRASEIDLARHHRVIDRTRSIVRAADDADVLLVHTTLAGTDIKLDVEFRTVDEVMNLAARVKEIYDYAARNPVLLTKTIDSRDKKLIHRLLVGQTIAGSEVLDAIKRAIPVAEYRYISYRWVASDFSTLLDLMGAWQARELDRAFAIARDYLLDNAQGYLHLLGLTNASGRKWIPVYFEQLVTSEALKASFRDLYAPRGTDWSPRSYVLRTVDLVDELFEAGAILLETKSAAPGAAEALRLLDIDRRQARATSHYAELEFEFRAKAYGISHRPTRDILDL